MPSLQRSPQTLYAAVILAALVAVIVVARRQQGPMEVSSPRAAPELANARTEQKSSSRARPPRPLVITERVSPVPSAAAIRSEVPAGFPEDESDDLGPVRQEEAGVYSPKPETPATVPGMRRLASVEKEDASEHTPAAAPSAPVAPAPKFAAGPRLPHAVNAEALRPVLQQAAQLNRQAESLARRGAYYLARNVTIQSLRMIAEALDLQSGTGEHTAALASALTALREAGDFQSRSSEDSTVSVGMVVAGHKTPVLRQQDVEGLSAVAAQQQYFNYAKEQLVVAAGHQGVASHSLCNLGKLQPRMVEGSSPQQTNLAKAMVYQQAALAVDGRNYLAANELGALLANFGQLHDARRVLLHSVGTMSNPDGWRILTGVHQRLGETELAAHAAKQYELLTGGAGGPRPKIEWVSPEVFAGNQPATPAKTSAPAKTAAAVTPAKSEARTADARPKQKETWISPFGLKR
ncbi:MAG: hypothetical protein K8R36_11145 [Planctomycetales bacterium]|nr:hypothetical protein [Planctomycetales bacterium]